MRKAPAEPSPSPRIAGLVLAAGRSTRMAGGSKLLAGYAGTTVIHRVVATALAAGLEPLVVVVRHDARDERAALEGLPVRFCEVPRSPEGRLVSVVSGLGALAGLDVGGVAILLGDEPGLAPDDIRAVGVASDPGAPVALRARYGDRPGHPVFLPARMLPSIPDLARQYGPEAGLWDVLVHSDLPTREVPVAASSPIDVDTAADLARAVERERATGGGR